MRLAFLALLLVPAVASADVVGGGPETCPAGSDHRFCHGPALCALAPCSSDASCESGEICEPVSLCVGMDYCGGGWGGGGGPVEIGVASCAGGAACPADSTCRSVTGCVPGTRPDAGPGGPSHHVYGCGCTAGGRDGAWLLALAPLALVLARRRL